MTLSNQLTPVLTLAKRKWQEVVPEWLQPEANSDYWWDARLYPKGNERSTHVAIHPDAAALIITGSLAKWLAGQGIAVRAGTEDPTRWFMDAPRDFIKLDSGTDYLSALIAATNARLDELPDKPGAGGAE